MCRSVTPTQAGADPRPAPRWKDQAARQDLTPASTAQTNRLRALLRDGDDTDRQLAPRRAQRRHPHRLARRRLSRATPAAKKAAVRTQTEISGGLDLQRSVTPFVT